MPKPTRSQRKSSRARRARASDHGHESLPDAAPYAPPPRDSSSSLATAAEQPESGDFGDLPQERGWKSWPLAARVGIIMFLVFAVVVIVMKFVSTL